MESIETVLINPDVCKYNPSHEREIRRIITTGGNIFQYINTLNPANKSPCIWVVLMSAMQCDDYLKFSEVGTRYLFEINLNELMCMACIQGKVAFLKILYNLLGEKGRHQKSVLDLRRMLTSNIEGQYSSEVCSYVIRLASSMEHFNVDMLDKPLKAAEKENNIEAQQLLTEWINFHKMCVDYSLI